MRNTAEAEPSMGLVIEKGPAQICDGAAGHLWELAMAVWGTALLSRHHPGLGATDPGAHQLSPLDAQNAFIPHHSLTPYRSFRPAASEQLHVCLKG